MKNDDEEAIKKNSKRNKIITIIIITMAVIGMIVAGFSSYLERQDLIKDFTEQATRLQAQESMRNETVKSAEELVEKGASTIDKQLVTTLEKSIENAKSLSFIIPEMARSNEKLFEQFADLRRTDNSQTIFELAAAHKAVEDSMAKAAE